MTTLPAPRASQDVAKLQELFPSLTESMTADVLKNCSSLADAAERLSQIMTSPNNIESSESRVTIPDVDDDAEYPDLCSTVESAYEVLSKRAYTSGEQDEEDEITKVLDFEMVTDVDVGEWCLLEETECTSMGHCKAVQTTSTSTYAQAAATCI